MHSFRNGTPRVLLALLVGVPGVAWLTSCSPSSGTASLGNSHNGDGSGSSPGAGSASGSGSTSGGGDGNGSGSDGNLGLGDTTGGSGGPNGGADASGCSTETHESERQAVDMYFIVNQSGSMNEGSPSKWTAVSGSLQSFLADPANAGTGAGIGYFPFTGGGGGGQCTQGQAGCLCIPFINVCISNAGGSCTVSDYAKPDVGIAQLPGVAAAINTSLGAHGPGGGTPTYPALQGTYQYTSAWAIANPGRKTIVVLATDGDPTGCDADNQVGNATTTGSIAGDLVAPAYAGNTKVNPPVPPIPTFVIGVGSSLTSLDALAKAGGTGQAFIVDTGGDVAKQFAAALDQIRGQAVSCDFSIPNDGTVDKSLVNAKYTPPGAAPTDVYNVADQGHCSATDNDWYYNSDQTKITLCPNICQTLAQGGGSVQVVLGCPTVVQPVH